MHPIIKIVTVMILVCVCAISIAPSVDLLPTALRACRAAALILLALAFLAALPSLLLERPRCGAYGSRGTTFSNRTCPFSTILSPMLC